MLAVLGATAALTLGASAAWATGPYTISAGAQTSGTVAYTGSTTGASPQIQFNSPNVEMGCDSGTAAGDLFLGSNATGDDVGSITSSTWTNCVGPFGLPMSVTHAGTWSLNLTGTPTGGVTVGNIDEVNAHVEATGDPETCSFDVIGSVDGNFNESGQALTITTPTAIGALFTVNVVGCFGLVDEGGPATFEGAYALANPAGPIAIN